MRNAITLFVFTLLLSACQSGPSEGEMLLTGKINGLKKGRIVLQKQIDTILVGVDSMDVDGMAEFRFIDAVDSPQIYFLTVHFQDSVSRSRQLPFFAEASSIDIQTNLKEFPMVAWVNGSANQDLLEEYRSLVDRFNQKNLEYIEGQLNAIKDGNDSLNDVFSTKQERLLRSKYLATVNFAMNHSDMEVAPYLMLSEAFDAHIKYLDTIYNGLTPKIKDSKYGVELESFIAERKAQGL